MLSRACIVAALLVFGFSGGACRPGAAIDVVALREANSPAQEALALQGIVQRANTLGFIAYDSQGNKLPGADSPWTGQLHHIQLRVDGDFVDHQMIDPANLDILLD